MSRKPIPNIGVTPPEEDIAGSSTPRRPFLGARSSFASTTSAQAGSARMSFEAIDNAIVNMHNQTAGSGQPRMVPLTRSPMTQPPNLPALPRPPRPPSTSSDTLAGSDTHDASQGPDPYYRPASGPPVLPAINSGEELGWEEFDGNIQRDPFQDGQESVPLNSTPYSTTPGPSRGTPVPQARAYSRPGTAFTNIHTPVPPYPARPVSNISSYHLPSDYGASSYTTYSQAPGSHADDYAGHYDAQGRLMEDADAYATGNESTQMDRRQVRARSVTPMGNDEDMSFGDEKSVDYSETDYEPDEEKGKAGYGGYGYGYEPTRRAHYLNPQTGQVFEEKSPGMDYPDTPITTQHFGPAPVGRVARRIDQKKRVQLTNGNLVIDLNVPTKLVLPLRRADEMMKTRYTAVTCDPDDFKKNNFFLRQNEYGRRTELFICITMYNVGPIPSTLSHASPCFAGR